MAATSKSRPSRKTRRGAKAGAAAAKRVAPKRKAKASSSQASAARRKVDFVNAYFEFGENATAAAIAIGLSQKTARTAGWRMLTHADVREAVKKRRAELIEIGRVRCEVTRESISHDLDEDRKLARAAMQCSAAVSATMGKAKLHGLIIDQSEVGQPGQFERYTDEQLIAAAGKAARIIAGAAASVDSDAGNSQGDRAAP